MKVDVLLDSGASAAEITAVTDVLRDEGMEGSVKAAFSRRGADELPWVIFLMGSVAVFFTAFLKGFGQEAGRDTYQGLRRLISRLFRARRNSNGSVTLSDEDTRTEIVLVDGLPEEAYRQLAEKNLEELKGGYWTWDPKLGTWSRL